MKRLAAIASAVALITGVPALAELVYFARGGQAQLEARVVGDRVEVETPDGPLTFPKAEISAIVPGHRPLDEWSSRKALALRDGGLEARFAAAWWALENGLTDQAVGFLDELRPLASTPGPAARAIAALDRLAPPCPDPNLEPLRARLRPLRFREARGPHVVLFHQLGEAEAAERLDLIERVVRTFHIALGAQGIDTRAPERRISSVYFADRRDYVGFLDRIGSNAFSGTQGYYHPVLKAVFAFDGRSSEEQKAGRRAIGNLKSSGATRSETDRRRLLLDLDWRATDLGILAHETVHQLTVDGGFAPRFDDFPAWLHEGFASQFEVVRGGRWAGFGPVNDHRLPDWRSIKPASRLAPLLRDEGFGRGYRRDPYAEAWALVYFLRKEHPREFLAFLDLLRTPSNEATAGPDRAIDAFRSAFGKDLDRIEAEWHRYLAGLKTPLEEGRANAPPP